MTQSREPATESRGSDDAGMGCSDPADWVDVHGDAMYRFALLRVRDPDTAEEIVQEALLAALRGRREFSERSSERTWLIGILKHKVIDHFRRSGREVQVGELEEPDPVVETVFTKRGLWSGGPRRWSSDPAKGLEADEFWVVFRSCVGHLPPSMADAFCLRELESMNGKEICQVLDISPSNLWALLHRARIRLRQCLENNWFDRKERAEG